MKRNKTATNKFKITIEDTSGKIHTEEYIKDIISPRIYFKKMIEHFNATLRPHEFAKELIKIEQLHIVHDKLKSGEVKKYNKYYVIYRKRK